MDLIDSHCHIHMKDFKLDFKEVMTSAEEVGVIEMICVGCDVKDSQRSINLSKKHTNIWSSVGIHPHEAENQDFEITDLQKIEKLANHKKVIAIGECGLDYHYHSRYTEKQAPVLRKQIEISLEHDLPIIFHVRDAFPDFWDIFDSYSNIKGEIHSFSGNLNDLDRALSNNLFLGINGIATFSKPEQLEVIKRIPLSNLLLETDAPFLTPVPYRGTMNEPKNIVVIAEFLSKLREENLEDICIETTSNARHLFRL